MKKIGFLTLLIAAMFLLALTFSMAGPKAPSVLVPVAAASPAATVVAPVPPPHPRIHEAIEMMHGAKEKLEHAEGDFHGHRHKAIEHLEQAIHQAEECEREP